MLDSTGHTKAHSEGLHTVMESDLESWQKQRPKSTSQKDYKKLFEITKNSTHSQLTQAVSDEIPEFDYDDYFQHLRPSVYTQKSQKQTCDSFKEEKQSDKDLFIPMSEDDKKQICESDKHQIKLNRICMRNGGSYSGQWHKRKPNGQGEYIFSDQSKYIGEWVYGFATGKGTFQDIEGGNYIGDFQGNCMHGYGIYKYADGSTYDGQWCQDKYHGIGNEIKKDIHYKGKFKNGSKHGNGLLIFKNQEKYEGLFLNDQFEGKGVYTWPDGRRYEGDWKKGMMHGQGILMWPDGRVYVGSYVNDKRQGFGTFQYSDGRKYSGEWMNGVQHGTGEFIEPSGQITKGVWREGKLVSHF